MATHSSRRLDALPTRTARQGNRTNGIGVFGPSRASINASINALIDALIRRVQVSARTTSKRLRVVPFD
jgi:hypothetical protein